MNRIGFPLLVLFARSRSFPGNSRAPWFKWPLAEIRATIPEVKMKSNLSRIRDSKQGFRKQLAARPISEKLRMLDALRERALAIRGRSVAGSIKKATKDYCKTLRKLA
jgi:hypothetical protein